MSLTRRLLDRFPALALAAGLILVLAATGARAGASLEDRLFLAADAYYTGDFKKAVQAFGDVLEEDPDNLYARSRLGASLAAAGGPGADAAAMEKFEAVLAKAPGHLFARTWKGLVLLESGDPSRAEAECAQALRLDPDYPPAMFVAALARLESGDTARALELFTRLTAHDHAEAEIHAATARVFTRLGLLAAANQEWERALALRPSDPAWLSSLGALLARQGKDALAVTAFEQVLAMGPADAAGNARAKIFLAATLAEQAWRAAAEGRAPDALALCRAALRVDPGQAGCLYLARRGGVPAKPADSRETTPAAPDRPPQPQKPQAPPPAPAGSGATGSEEALVAGSLAKLRSGPGAEHDVVRVLPPGLRLRIVGRQGDWVEALTPGGGRGFVRADLIHPAAPGQ